MQSQSPGAAAPASVPPFANVAWRSVAAIVWFGVVPLLGLFAELMTGALSQWLPLFPTWWHVGGVLAAVIVNLLLHVGAWRAPRWLVLRAGLVGGVAGMALLYALAEAPAGPAMVLLSFLGLGILAMAPFFVAFGMLRLVPHLRRDWVAAGRSPVVLAALLLGLALLPVTVTIGERWLHVGAATRLVDLARAMRRGTEADGVERLAARACAADLRVQRALCRDGRIAADEGFGEGFAWLDGGRTGHLANGRPFWFVTRMGTTPREVGVDRLRMAFHRAHGHAWDDFAADRRADAGSGLEWQSSRVVVRHEPDAALMYVEHQLEVHTDQWRNEEAWFDVRLPAGAVASSLSLWIGDEERPAAFGGAGKVAQAYAAVVRRDRDPALLQERSPGLVRLQLFPVTNRQPPMRARLGFTVPMRTVGDGLEAWLPRIVAHNCAAGAPRVHSLVVGGPAGSPPRTVADAELARPIRAARGAAAAQARDADGWVVQRLVPRTAAVSPPAAWIVVLDASASVRAAVADPAALLAALPGGAPAEVFAAHGDGFTRCAASVGSAELAAFVRGLSFTGGVDARAALAAALEAAAEAGGVPVLWLHGAAAVQHDHDQPSLPAGQVAALALHPGSNVLREHLAGRTDVFDVPRHGGALADLVASLAEFVRFGAISGDEGGECERRWSRARVPASEVTVVSDQLPRLWAAATARDESLAGKASDAVALAARYRVVTAGAGAVVLESEAQYRAFGLDPGAAIGTEPRGLVGGGAQPVPELSTVAMLASGLLLLAWWRRRRA